MAATPARKPANEIPPAPVRKDDAHKGDCGRALIVAGSRGMSGAACLAGTAALRGGAGLVTVACAESIIDIVAGYEPSYLTIGLPDDEEGRIQSTAIKKLTQTIENQSAVAIGPGLGQSASLMEVVTELYSSVAVPCVVDADALNLLSKRRYLLKRVEGATPRVITPHPGEFSRLTGLDIPTIQKDRQNLAEKFAGEHNIVVVLKGKSTVITDGKRTAINATGNSGMATGGTGDVLTGVIVALLAQGMSAFEAAQLGAHLHGLAGDLAAEELSKHGMIASDLLHFLGRAWCELEP